MNPKRQRFVDAYLGVALGNATEAARIAGYKHPMQQGSRLLSFDEVRDAVSKAAERTATKATADHAERMEFYASMMRGELPETRMGAQGPYEAGTSNRDRLKGAEILSKIGGDFEIHNLQKGGEPSVVIAVKTVDELRALARRKGE